MHDEVGIAADRRREMGVAAQIEAEMSEILRRIFVLRLRAQHHLIDQPFDIAAFDSRQDAVETVGAKRSAFRQRYVEGGEKLPQAVSLFPRPLSPPATDPPHPPAPTAFP